MSVADFLNLLLTIIVWTLFRQGNINDGLEKSASPSKQHFNAYSEFKEFSIQQIKGFEKMFKKYVQLFSAVKCIFLASFSCKPRWPQHVELGDDKKAKNVSSHRCSKGPKEAMHPKIFSISRRFVLREAVFETKYFCSIKGKIFGPSQNFGLAAPLFRATAFVSATPLFRATAYRILALSYSSFLLKLWFQSFMTTTGTTLGETVSSIFKSWSTWWKSWRPRRRT